MGYVRKLFEPLPWTKLRPAPDAVEQVTGKQDPSKFVACAAADVKQNGVFVLYFPAGARAIVKLDIRGTRGSVRWFNPRDGEWVERSPRGVLTPPDDEDWVLVVKP